MTVELDELYLVLPVFGTVVALVLLWYISAKLRHRRQASYMATGPKIRVPETVPSLQGQRRGRRGSSGRQGEARRGQVQPGNSDKKVPENWRGVYILLGTQHCL